MTLHDRHHSTMEKVTMIVASGLAFARAKGEEAVWRNSSRVLRHPTGRHRALVKGHTTLDCKPRLGTSSFGGSQAARQKCPGSKRLRGMDSDRAYSFAAAVV